MNKDPFFQFYTQAVFNHLIQILFIFQISRNTDLSLNEVTFLKTQRFLKNSEFLKKLNVFACQFGSYDLFFKQHGQGFRAYLFLDFAFVYKSLNMYIVIGLTFYNTAFQQMQVPVNQHLSRSHQPLFEHLNAAHIVDSVAELIHYFRFFQHGLVLSVLLLAQLQPVAYRIAQGTDADLEGTPVFY